MVRFIASPGRRSLFAIAALTQPRDSVVYRATPQAALTYAEQSIPRPGVLPPQTYGVDSIDAARSRIACRSASDGSFDWGSARPGSAVPGRTSTSSGAGAAGAFGPFGSARSESSDARTIGPSVAQSSSTVTARAANRRSVPPATKDRLK